MIKLYRFADAPRELRGVFGDRTFGFAWLASVPADLKPFWNSLGVPWRATYYDPSEQRWILAGSRQRPAADELATGNLFEGAIR